mgnify:CR=1 FL=1
MAIGDDFTDIEMLQYAGIGVAMGNAPLEVRAAADWVTTTIEEDGVARAIDSTTSAKVPRRIQALRAAMCHSAVMRVVRFARSCAWSVG